jgi:hypothetical protein
MKLVGQQQRAWMFATIALSLAHSAAADDVVPAVWKKQEISFVYRGGGSGHTCGGLRTQLRSLLIALGAHEATTVTAAECDDAALAREVAIFVASPFEAAAVDSDAQSSSTEALIARVRGEVAEATPATFPARWKTISFANAMSLRLSPGDCELLKQLQRDVMPRLSVRVLRDKVLCRSDLGSGSRPQLVVAALVDASGSAARE